MSDELEAFLRRRFASAEQPLEDEAFAAQMTARINAAARWRFDARNTYAILSTIVGGLGAALSVLRLKHARLMVMGAAAVTVWATFL